MQPINIKQLYGNIYRIAHDPAAQFECGGKQDPWLFVIPGKYAEIYPYSDRLLAVMVVGKYQTPKVAKLGLRAHQVGDTEAVFLFTPDQFDQVAQIVKPRKRRRLSAEGRQRLAEIGRAYQFKPQFNGVQVNPGSSGRVSGLKGTTGLEISPQTGKGGLFHESTR